ncbi:hypothetical protein J7I93_10785 [Bacillus sp. ISL-47]|uniref:hypothetical protein n=1 Tax=Bacillus sp. ISL-47 TaxID=2819130 RepID=UPI001BEC6DCC|nr:hypothetical protein [Bacillus sp. ISL-47]MBT2688672.1 hypothetical protein [Bacillus sp. ISL-47]MBT2709978.1 hypothetical protein [Pseudomonas sp. ISL-84]
MLDSREKNERSQTPPITSVNEEMNTAGTTPNSSNAMQSLEPEFDITGTVLNDYS